MHMRCNGFNWNWICKLQSNCYGLSAAPATIVAIVNGVVLFFLFQCISHSICESKSRFRFQLRAHGKLKPVLKSNFDFVYSIFNTEMLDACLLRILVWHISISFCTREIFKWIRFESVFCRFLLLWSHQHGQQWIIENYGAKMEISRYDNICAILVALKEKK